MVRERRSWKTIRVVEGRWKWLAHLAKLEGKSIADVVDEILGEFEARR